MGVRGIFRKELDAVASCRSTARFAVAAMLASVPAAYAQQTSRPQTEKTDKAAQEELVKKPEPPNLPDIVSDNLDHVSATAEQILQIPASRSRSPNVCCCRCAPP